MSIVFDFAAINRRLNRKPGHTTNFVALTSGAECGCADRNSIAALRAEVERLEQEQDILGLRLLADDKLLNRFE